MHNLFRKIDKHNVGKITLGDLEEHFNDESVKAGREGGQRRSNRRRIEGYRQIQREKEEYIVTYIYICKTLTLQVGEERTGGSM